MDAFASIGFVLVMFGLMQSDFLVKYVALQAVFILVAFGRYFNVFQNIIIAFMWIFGHLFFCAAAVVSFLILHTDNSVVQKHADIHQDIVEIAVCALLYIISALFFHKVYRHVSRAGRENNIS